MRRTGSTTIQTPLGPAVAEASDAGLTSLRFDEDARGGTYHEPRDRRDGESEGCRSVLDAVAGQLAGYFAGERTGFTVPLAPEGTAFERAVWDRLLRIPYGMTTSYASIARDLGKPGAARAVGRANGRNPVWLVIPCHRVVAANGSLCGYAGGVDRKRWLIDHETTGRCGREKGWSLLQHTPG
ncbi:MAG: methylated-DNA--[protein]-cysteine S-methyltransferase [Planctomycetota bacterium]